jgi:ribonuclease Z
MANTRRVNGALLALLMVLPHVSCAVEEDGASGCLEVILTGTQGGPPAVNGLAGAGTLVRYGSVANKCSDVLLQFDVGRGTTERLSEIGVSPNNLNAVFLTHLHSDHTEGLIGLMQLRWHFNGGELDVICSGDVASTRPPPARVLSCRGFTQHIGDAFIYAGEIAQRHAENGRRSPAGPAALIDLKEIAAPLPLAPGTVVWEADGVKVSAIATTHIAGSLAYRVDTTAGSVVIGGDAGNKKPGPPRESSTSETVEALAEGADILVHSVIHPVFAPGGESSFPGPVYLRQSSASDLGAMAERAGISHLVMTHLIPSLNSPAHGPFQVPGGPIVAEDFQSEARQGGYQGLIYVGSDLLTLRIP